MTLKLEYGYNWSGKIDLDPDVYKRQGLIGIPLGLLSGIGGIGVTLSVVNRLMIGSMYNEDIVLRLIVSPVTVPATAAFVALIIFISAYLPARRAAATSPIEAIRLSADIEIKGKTVKTSRLTRRLFGIEGELALKNLKRNRRRYRTTVFSLFISIVLFISFSTFINYAFTGAGLYYQDIPFDISVSTHDLSPEKQKELYDQITALNEVERCAMVREVIAESWLSRSQFGSKSYIDQVFFPTNEEGHYQCMFHLIALGEDEFNAYAAENGLDATTFRDTANFKGILINKNILQETTLAEYEPLKVKAGEKLALEGMLIERDDPKITPSRFTMEIGAVKMCIRDRYRNGDAQPKFGLCLF